MSPKNDDVSSDSTLPECVDVTLEICEMLLSRSVDGSNTRGVDATNDQLSGLKGREILLRGGDDDKLMFTGGTGCVLLILAESFTNGEKVFSNKKSSKSKEHTLDRFGMPQSSFLPRYARVSLLVFAQLA
jgi:hypothetical protein